MNPNEVDILLVDDSQDDMDLTLHALRAENLANSCLRGARWGGSAGIPFLHRPSCRTVLRSSPEAGICWI